jgi:DUF1365 family protein
MESCIYEGVVRHRRFEPVSNDFEYPLFMMYLDLDELPTLFRDRWLWSCDRPAVARFRRSDHLGPSSEPLDVAVRRLVERRTGISLRGPIRLLTHLAYFGYGFNPVSFYYCFEGTEVRVIVAEVNNTPWGEQHCYVLTGPSMHYRLEKEFHVSPFMGMQQDYAWQFTAPGRTLAVHMENFENETKLFDATLSLRREEITTWNLNRRLVSYPAMTLQVMARIYWQALKLWWKKAPYYPHPSQTRPVEEPMEDVPR